MAPRAEPLADCYILNPDASITCNICSDRHETIRLGRRSLPVHSRSKRHINNQAAIHNRAITREQLLAQAHAPELVGDPVPPIVAFQPLARAFSLPLPVDNDPARDDFYSQDDYVLNFQEIEKPKYRDMEREMERFLVWEREKAGERLGWRSATVEAVPDEEDARNIDEDMIPDFDFDEPEVPDSAEDIARELGIEIDRNGDWWPYLNKTLFLLDTIDNLPRLRLSDSHMKLMLWMLKEAGCRDVPTFNGLRAMQSTLREHGSVRTKAYTSSLGNLFYMNSIADIVAKDLANPMVRKHMRFYPEEPADGIIREVWHGEKWCKTLKVDHLTPMCVHPTSGKHFYVKEVARHLDGRLVIPVRWIMRNGELCADVHVLTDSADGLTANLAEVVNIRASELHLTLPDLCEDQLYMSRMNSDPWWAVNKLRTVANGLPMYTILVDIWGDDVSGNTSKSYNKHDNLYLANRCLPRRLLQQEFHVHFLSTSQHASVPEQFSAVKEEISASLANPIPIYDALDPDDPRVVLIRLALLTGPGDNPMHSAECAHIGMGGGKLCRKCKVGGTKAHKMSDDGFKSLMKPGIPRSGDETRKQVEEQLRTATLGSRKAVKDMQSATGTKCQIAEVWIERLLNRARQAKVDNPRIKEEELRATGLAWLNEQPGDKMTATLLIDNFDVNQSTPVEILHTVLLGLMKYCWHSTHTKWNPQEKVIFTQRLAAANLDGLTLPPIQATYYVQYANSLIGRQFKALMQTGTFCIADLVPPLTLALWKAVGILGSLFWVPEISNPEQYERDTQQAIDNVIDAFAQHDPKRMFYKGKLHVTTHALEDIKAYGPLVGCATEVYECWNAIFRLCSVLSNGLAASRDISRRLASMESFKQRITGGFWHDQEAKRPVRASLKVRSFIYSNKTLQKHLGWTQEVEISPGAVKLLPKARSELLEWSATQAADATFAPHFPSPEVTSSWDLGESVVAASGDKCKVDSWVFAQLGNLAIIGRIRQILQKDSLSVVVLKRYCIDDELNPTLGMPYLRPVEGPLVGTGAKDIHFIFNAQHDCITGGCVASGTRFRKQERVETKIEDKYLVHNPNHDAYFLNLHGLHNHHLLRLSLPTNIISPRPVLHPDTRDLEHSELASMLRELLQSQKEGEPEQGQDEGTQTTKASTTKKKATTAKQKATTTKAKATTAKAKAMTAKAKAAAATKDTAGTDEVAIQPESSCRNPRKKRKREFEDSDDDDGESPHMDSDSDDDTGHQTDPDDEDDAEAAVFANLRATGKESRASRARNRDLLPDN